MHALLLLHVRTYERIDAPRRAKRLPALLYTLSILFSEIKKFIDTKRDWVEICTICNSEPSKSQNLAI